MMNKKVPDWLNSSVWFSNRQRDRITDHYYATTTAASTTASTAAPLTEAPVPVPPPSVTRREEPPPGAPKIKVTVKSEADEEAQPARRPLSEEDVSLQSQLVAEVCLSLCLWRYSSLNLDSSFCDLDMQWTI